MIKIKSATAKVYIVCPANQATGGPELLHQLAFRLRASNIDALMYYLPTDDPKPIHPFYEHYQVPYVATVANHTDHVVIIPESLTNMIYDKRFAKMTKAIWWLSVDHYFSFVNNLLAQHQKKKTFTIKHFFNYYKIPTLKHLTKAKKIVHFAQSAYAIDFLSRHQINNVFYLSDYLNQAFLNGAAPDQNKGREDIVLYNPKKGLNFTQEIIKQAPQIKFLPIQHLTPDEVSALLRKSKVYLDFGSHPGKDRFPREAAIMGCCIITGRQGSANFSEDLPIDNSFKFNDEQAEIPKIIEKIKACLNHFEEESKHFDSYREWINLEPKKFEDDVAAIFKKQF
jgi:hypothetical protein